MSLTEHMFEINSVTSRIMGQQATFSFCMTAGVEDGSLSLDDFDIRDSKGVGITSKMANTIIHNVAMELEDSKHNGTYFKVIRSNNSFRVICNGTRGLGICIAAIKRDLERSHSTIKKCRADVRKIADTFGVETVQHVLHGKRMDAI